jgi:hypothetical protein
VESVRRFLRFSAPGRATVDFMAAVDQLFAANHQRGEIIVTFVRNEDWLNKNPQ